MPLALVSLALAVFVMGTSEFMLGGLLPAIAAEFDVPIGTAGLLTPAFAVGMVVGAPVMAAFARRWPARRTLLCCLAAFAACHVLGALTDAFPLVLVTRALAAIANAGFLAVAMTTATALVPADARGRALSVLLSGTTIATVVGVPAGALVGSLFGWRATFWAVALLCIPAVLGIARGVRDVDLPTPADASSPGLRAELAQAARPAVVRAMVLAALVNGGTFAVLTYLAPIVIDVARRPEWWVSVALVLFGIGSFLGVTIAGRFADRRAGPLLAVGGPLLLTGWVLLATTAGHPVVLLVLVCLLGVLSFAVGATLVTRILYAAAGAPTMAGSYATAALNAGAVVGPVLGALALAVRPAPIAPVWVAALLTATALVGLVIARRGTPGRRD